MIETAQIVLTYFKLSWRLSNSSTPHPATVSFSKPKGDAKFVGRQTGRMLDGHVVKGLAILIRAMSFWMPIPGTENKYI